MLTSEAHKRASKKWKEANKEKIKEYNKKYREANKEKIKEYNIKIKDKKKENNIKYNKTETGKKNITISSWITKSKIKFDDRTQAEYYYNSYINTHRCNWCDEMFKDCRDRCMDHCHTCSLPRAIICRECNIKDLVPCVNCLL